jgi:hypothetical protein
MCLEPAAAGVERAACDVLLCPVLVGNPVTILAPVRFLGSSPVAAQRLGTERRAGRTWNFPALPSAETRLPVAQ